MAEAINIDNIEQEKLVNQPVETLLYAETEHYDDIANYDAVLFTVCDIFGRPRGRFAFGSEHILKFAQLGMETDRATCVLGFQSEYPTTLPRYNSIRSLTCLMHPDLTTLKPLSWLCNDNRKVGHVLCDLYDIKGELDICSPRSVALKQLKVLKNLDYQIMSSFETEYTIYLKGTLNSYGGDYNDVVNMVRLDTDVTFYYDNIMGLLASGIPVETQMEEFAPGQIEYSMKPQYGIKMADDVHRLRYVSKALCDRNGLDATFMTRPNQDTTSSGFHFNHSLWTMDGKNAFYNPDDDNKCSDIMRHWLAGLIHHGNALVALMCPTANCYERLHDHFAPGDNIWNYNDRHARLRVKNRGKNIYIEERTPSSACNPYLCLAGLIAAGVDGIRRKLEAPPPQIFRPLISGDEKAKPQNPLPKTLEEALQALEKDTVLTESLGKDFVQDYVALCQEFQLEKLKDVMNKEQAIKFEVERDLFLHML